MRSDPRFYECMKLLLTVVQNILRNPGVDKYCKLRLSNAAMNKNIAQIPESRFLLEMIGFEQMKLIPPAKPGNAQFTAAPEDYLLLVAERADPRDMQMFVSILTEIVEKNSIVPLTSKIHLTAAQKAQIEESKKPKTTN